MANKNNPGDILAAMLGVESGDLRTLLELFNDEERGAMESEVVIDPLERMDQFRNQDYAPRATGVKHIFLGGNPHPASPGQQRGENVFAAGSALANILGTGGVQNFGASLRDTVLPAIVDAWKRRKGQGGQA